VSRKDCTEESIDNFAQHVTRWHFEHGSMTVIAFARSSAGSPQFRNDTVQVP
jgi:hypothetical protein